ncbi:hypothetical protein BST61_g170 [Cercospora zeina]
MTGAAGATSYGGWTLIHTDGQRFEIVKGPEDNVSLVHVIVPCDSTKMVCFAQVMLPAPEVTKWQNYGVHMAGVMSRLSFECPKIRRLFVELSFGTYRTSIAEPAQFGSWVKAIVKAALAAQFDRACRIYAGVTDIANEQFKVADYVEALGHDKFGFFDDPAVVIMMRKGQAVCIGLSNVTERGETQQKKN